ncbi:2'-5' RNA ligase family protein [Bdellovibrio sp. HCB-162]|uniref:2'-5' RNA ligase family protein n=1 Tax=Bdellovibrio sp. HCB-162 TaxID=3394234 RepID=UPI0039BCA1D8
MGFAVKCYFTESTAAPDSVGLASFLKASGSRPGITLGLWEDVDEQSLRRIVDKFSKLNLSPPTVFSYGVATFPTDPAHAFLGIAPTKSLLDFHRKLHEVDDKLTKCCSEYYLPGNWIPHSTLAIRCPRSDLGKIVEKCLEHETRIEAKIGSIGIVETGTARQIFEVSL